MPLAQRCAPRTTGPGRCRTRCPAARMRRPSRGWASAASASPRCGCLPTSTSRGCSTASTSGCRSTRCGSARGCWTGSSSSAEPTDPFQPSILRDAVADTPVVSSGCCNEELVEGLGRSLPVQGFAWPPVEFGGDGVQVGLGQGAEVGDALGEVLPQQPVGVLVGAALPGGVRVAEVDRAAGGDAEGGVRGEFLALVPGQRAQQVLG